MKKCNVKTAHKSPRDLLLISTKTLGLLENIMPNEVKNMTVKVVEKIWGRLEKCIDQLLLF